MQQYYFYRNGSCSIGDTNGLILYAGLLDNNAPLNCYVWNKFDKPIVNSNSIYGGAWYHSSLLVPNPSNDSMLYLFTIGVAVGEQLGLYYSTINYKINNDSGIVLQKNIQLSNYPEFDALMG
ncbi:MAG: hypothetical protein IPP46_01105 [Bacteroidetes bacterium]|nr:hypothetical protein [Bacteroidota bacterium]